MEHTIIGLMTDWGRDDGAYGACQGVIWGINPRIQIADMSQNIESWDVKQAAFLLMVHCSTYPGGTIFVPVIDPGVGTARKEILVQTQNYYFVGPNNGVMSWALRKEKIQKVIHLTNKKYFRSKVSAVFEGRDIFCPVAAWLSKGVSVEKFGEEIKRSDLFLEKYPIELGDSQFVGEVLYVDKFGNLITSIEEGIFEQFTAGRNFGIRIGETVIEKLSRTYEDGKETKTPLAIFGGDFGDLLDIVVYEDSAAQKLGVKVGDKIVIER